MNPHRCWPGLSAALLAALPFTAQGAAQHPLDALEASEIVATTAVLRSAGHVDDKTLIALLTLQEPPKADVLAWKTGDPIPRQAKAVLRRNSTTSRTTASTFRWRGSCPSVLHTEQKEQCFGQPRTVWTDAHM